MGEIARNKIDIESVAEYFLAKEPLTPKKLQKLVYYAYAWFVALNNEPGNIKNVLFDERPEAWMHGPVFPSLYQKYKMYGWQEIPKTQTKPNNISADLCSFLDDIWSVFGDYSADQLETMTHQEDPWKKARGDASAIDASNNKIDLQEIFVYYNRVSQQAN